ncbi:hypothetical protein Tco_0375667 [Tanacetum coccineum]
MFFNFLEEWGMGKPLDDLQKVWRNSEVRSKLDRNEERDNKTWKTNNSWKGGEVKSGTRDDLRYSEVVHGVNMKAEKDKWRRQLISFGNLRV